jgi:two-component system, OmpR family, sensor kinase
LKFSLKRRLIAILLGLILLAWGMSSLVTGIYAERFIMSQVDRQLEHYSDLVHFITQVFSRQADAGLPLAEPWSIDELEQGLLQPLLIEGSIAREASPAVNIWLGDTLLAVLESSLRFDKPTTEGLSNRYMAQDGSNWRVLSRFDKETDLWILVAVEIDAARREILSVSGRAMLPLLFIIPLTLFILYFGVTRGLQPLKTLAGQISRRSPRALDPVDASGVPEEIEPVVDALNTLLERLAYALEGEQRFTANAAHELKTPLAAIKTEVQLCQRQLADLAGRAMLERIVLRVDRASHTVEQLLTLARLDPEQPLPHDSVDLQALLTDIVLETAHLAADRNLELQRSETGPVRLEASGETVAILLRNLLVNAFRYADEGSTVGISLRDEGTQVILEISNDCPALSGEELARISERFYRVPGTTGLGAGLGLSIVSRVAVQHGAQFSVAAGKQGEGFIARIVFPRQGSGQAKGA